MKRFSDYPSKTERTSSLWFRKTVNSLLIIMCFWFFFKASQRKTYFPNCIHLVLTIGSCLHWFNTFLAKWPRSIKQYGNDNQISELMSGKITGGTQISDFSEIIMSSSILWLWKNPEEFWDAVFCELLPGALWKWCMTAVSLKYTLPHKKCNLPTQRGSDILADTFH